MKKSIFIQFVAIIKKELRTYFNSPIAYIFIVALLGFSFWMFFRGFFLQGQLDMRSFFDLMPWVFLLLIPALTMRVWAEESRQGTIETLLTSSVPLPLSVLAKYEACMAFLKITILSTIVLPITLSFIGSLDWGTVIIAYIGVLLLGACYVGVGLVISSITNNQIVSFIVSALICFFFLIMSQPIVTYSLPSFIVPVINFFSFGSHYESITRGVLDTRDLIYYLSFIALSAYLNIQILESRK
jgi:ABC-2 type transport system permease protein